MDDALSASFHNVGHKDHNLLQIFSQTVHGVTLDCNQVKKQEAFQAWDFQVETVADNWES